MVKFLYNYPDHNVFKLEETTKEPRRADFGDDTSKSPVDKSNRNTETFYLQPKTQRICKQQSENVMAFDSSLTFIDNVANVTQMVNEHSFDAYKNKGKTLGLTAQPFNNQPITTSNKIQQIAETIYKRYGKNGRLEIQEFIQWNKLHKEFLINFKEWFQMDFWSQSRNEKSGKCLLNFHQRTPIAEDQVKIQKFRSFKKTTAFIRLYDHFLMIFKTSEDTVPCRVIILKLIDVNYNIEKHKILITHPNPGYDKIKVVMPNESAFNKWKKIFDDYTNDCIMHKYQFDDSEIIGKGKFSKVYRVEEKCSSKEFALKMVNKRDLLIEERQLLMNEASLLRIFNHENIIKLHNCIETNDFYFYIFDLVKGSDLFQYITKRKFLDEHEASWIMKGILEAVDYVHSTGIVHRDLKPENVMLEFNSKGEISHLKLIDFGLACYMEDKNALDNRCGTLNYAAPEVLLGSEYGSAIDVFSLGCIMYFMIRGKLPFYSDDQYIVAKKTVEGDYELDNDDFFLNVSDGCKSLLRGLLNPAAKDRISLATALKSDWIQKGEILKKYKNKNRENFDLNKYI